MHSHSLNKKDSKNKNDRGQLSIFFGVTLVILITVMAFIVNVGLFVKAKINLQNAVDAAAWSGAAVQARQLSNIAYLNWEMRNVYKEWMFKYYVLGQLANPETSSGSSKDFRIRKHLNSAGPVNALKCTDVDCFNLPSVCIHFSEAAQGTANICGIFKIPGLPRFESPGLPGIDGVMNATINALVQSKSNDCSMRSKLNFYTTALWAYGAGLPDGMFKDAPQIAAERPGAYLQAMELAMRIRNLEKIVNLEPIQGINYESAIKFDQAKAPTPFMERPVKAFWAAYRNLENNDTLFKYSMKKTFTLTELAPSPPVISGVNLSTLLIPGGDVKKYYLDLKLNLINFATFYSAMVTTSNDHSASAGAKGDQASCGITKVAMPIPGHPLGFDKNPNVLTYYAVKGQANFVGLLNPFSKDRPALLTAYAAAKPFGGRIGPKLFKHNTTNEAITVRSDVKKSYPYASALNQSNAYGAGIPIPASSDFWAQTENDIIGGSAQGKGSLFVVPNMLYDFAGSMGIMGAEYIQKIQQTNLVTTENAGLFSSAQFDAFKDNLIDKTGAEAFSATNIEKSLNQVRAPTKYEYANYLIPSLDADFNDTQVESVGTGPQSATNGTIASNVSPAEISIFAPLFVTDEHAGWYTSADSVMATFRDYLLKNEPAIDAYTKAISDVAQGIRADGLSHSASELYKTAADTFHDNPGDSANPSCKSLAGKFAVFYKSLPKDKGQPGCDQFLADLFALYLQSRSTNEASYYYKIKFVKSKSGSDPNYMTAYYPGKNQGALDNQNGVINHPFLADPTKSIRSKRNFYSTKFIPVSSVLNRPESSYIGGQGAFTVYSEGKSQDEIVGQIEEGGAKFDNPIPDDGLLSKIKH